MLVKIWGYGREWGWGWMLGFGGEERRLKWWMRDLTVLVEVVGWVVVAMNLLEGG